MGSEHHRPFLSPRFRWQAPQTHDSGHGKHGAEAGHQREDDSASSVEPKKQHKPNVDVESLAPGSQDKDSNPSPIELGTYKLDMVESLTADSKDGDLSDPIEPREAHPDVETLLADYQDGGSNYAEPDFEIAEKEVEIPVADTQFCEISSDPIEPENARQCIETSR